MDSKVIIYGAGYRGTAFYEFIEKNGMGDPVYAFCDQNYDKIKEVDGKKVVSFQEACSYNLPFFISIIDEEAVKEVKKMIMDAGRQFLEFSSLAKEFGEDIVTLNRDFCAFFHIKGMDSYFDEAEEKACLDVFWKDGSPFYEKFKELNLGNVIELACGRGRHVPFYVDKSKKVTLVDILQENIDICKKRFQEKSNIEYYCNNGYALSSLSITDCLVSINTASTIFIAFNGQGWIKDLSFSNSTIYYTVPGSAYFVQMRGRTPSNFSGSGWSTSLRKMSNCTFYQIGTNNRFFNNVINSNSAVFFLEMQNTIFADCVVSSATGTEGVFRRICNAGNYGNVNYTLGYNTYYYSAVPGGFLDYDTSDENGRDHSGTAIKVEPKFVNAANGDFTLSSSEHIAKRCGDPRWLPTTE